MSLKLSGIENNNRADLKLLDKYYASGDLTILGKLFEKYMHLVYGVCLKYLKDRNESQDAVMSVFEKLVVELEKHKVDNFKSWLYVLTKNYCLMQLRSAVSERKKEAGFIKDNISFMENMYEMHPIDRENGISDKALEDCINKLKEEQMNCIMLFYYENRCYREIADTLEMDEARVKSHLQNAKRNLKICLESGNE
jgi:RNA polymerase sigma-70 factor (ECF subfamily)